MGDTEDHFTRRDRDASRRAGAARNGGEVTWGGGPGQRARGPLGLAPTDAMQADVLHDAPHLIAARRLSLTTETAPVLAHSMGPSSSPRAPGCGTSWLVSRRRLPGTSQRAGRLGGLRPLVTASGEPEIGHCRPSHQRCVPRWPGKRSPLVTVRCVPRSLAVDGR
jgi:hypothetical protein